jgi:hypothetical protein
MILNIKRLLNHPLLLAFLLMILLQIIAYQFFKDTNYIPVLAAVTTGLTVMFGYFATHYLAMDKEQKERKFTQCLGLVKKLRFFLLEKNHLGSAEHSKMRDELQDAYYSFSLLTSARSYEALEKMMKEFEIFLGDQQNPTKKENFRKAQSTFINRLREEFFIDKEIDFKTYDFQLEE